MSITLQEHFNYDLQLHASAIQGSALPARLNLEAQILNRQLLCTVYRKYSLLKLPTVSQGCVNLEESHLLCRPRRLPGFPMATTLQTEDLEMIGPSDYLGTEFEGTDVTTEPVIAVKK